jgi:cytoskeletal protein CcmA (bactofilin family)
MFSKEKEKAKSKFSFAADSISTVATSMKVVGDVEADHDMRIDGHVVGNIYCKARVVLGESGRIEGDLHAVNADIFGVINGSVLTDDTLCMKSKSTVNGNITVGKLNIEPNANFNGKCTMSSDANSKTLYVNQNTMVLQEN